MREYWGYGLFGALFLAGVMACGDDGNGSDTDGGMTSDGGTPDAQAPDTGTTDTGTPDTGTADAGVDAGPTGCTEGCTIVELAAGYGHTCARRENGEILCWGSNEDGELGDGRMRHTGGGCTPAGVTDPRDCSEVPVVVSEIDDATSISARGGRSTCALRPGGEVWCWGLEAIEQMASMARRERWVPELVESLTDETVAVSDSWLHTCAILGDGTVACLGQNEAGQLGNGTTDRTRTAVPVMDLSGAVELVTANGNAGPHSGAMGEVTCARTDTEVLCWGSNEFGQLGDGSMEHDDCGNLDRRDCSLTPVPTTDLGMPVEQLSLGREHACALLADDTLTCWGQNQSKQLGVETTGLFTNEPQPVTTLTGVMQVAAGGYFTCALLGTGEVQCWGANDEGQLGDGSLDHGEVCGIGGDAGDCSSPVVVDLPSSASFITAGYQHACALVEGGEVHCWGWNDRRQVGVRDREPKPAPQRVEGLE